MGARQLTAAEVRDRLRLAIAAFGPGTQRSWAAAHGVSHKAVNDVLQGRRPPAASLLVPLGLRAVKTVVAYEEVR